MLHSLHQLLSIIKNGQQNRLLIVQCYKSKIAISVLNVLQDHGFIQGFRFKLHEQNEKNNQEIIEILLKYNNNTPVISTCQLISKPSNRVYKSISGLTSLSSTSSISFQQQHRNPIDFVNGIYILSTSKGIISHVTAFKLNIGGEILCQIQ
jgi:small subunit ribosomal protein S8